MKKLLIGLVGSALVVAAIVAVVPKAKADTGRVAWYNSTNFTGLTSTDGSNNPAIVPAYRGPGRRTGIVFCNPQGFPVLLDFSNIPTNSADVTITNTSHIVIPANSKIELNLGEGYNGEFSIRGPGSTNFAPRIPTVQYGN